MLTRRDLLLGAAAASLGTLGPACSKSRTPSWPRKTVLEGVEFTELFPHEAAEESPLVVAIHGMGDRPERWVETWRAFPARAQIALPRAFDAHGDGWSWFTFVDGMTDEQFGAAVGAAEARLWKGLAKLAGRRRLVVTGFSQGGILSFAIASRHPAEVLHAFPVSGSCPGPLLPKDRSRAAPLLAFHGTVDKVLDIQWGREAVNAFKEQGNDARIKEYPGVGHTMTKQMQDDLWAEIVKAIG